MRSSCPGFRSLSPTRAPRFSKAREGESRPSRRVASMVARRHLLVEIEIGGRGTGDESSTAIEGEILDGPLDEHGEPTAELNDVHQVDEGPYEPGEQAGDVTAEDVG